MRIASMGRVVPLFVLILAVTAPGDLSAVQSSDSPDSSVAPDRKCGLLVAQVVTYPLALIAAGRDVYGDGNTDGWYWAALAPHPPPGFAWALRWPA